MTLYRKSFALVSVILISLVIVLGYAIGIALRDASSAEKQAGIHNSEIILHAVSGIQESVDAAVKEYALNSSVRTAIRSKNFKPLQDSLPKTLSKDGRIDSVILLDEQSNVVFQKINRHSNELASVAAGQGFLNPDMRRKLLQRGSVSGIVKGEIHPVLISARLMQSDNDVDKHVGMVIGARVLDQGCLREISKQTRMYVYMLSDDNAENGSSTSKPLSNQESVDVLIKDINRKAIATLRVLLPNRNYLTTRLSADYLMIALVVIALLLSVSMLIIIDRLVLRRIARLGAEVKKVGLGSDPSVRISLPGSDELANLASTINLALSKLEESQRKLEDANKELDQRVEERTQELRETMKSLEESRSAYRRLVENQNEFIVEFDVEQNGNWKRKFASPSYCDLFAITLDRFLDGSFAPMIHEDDLPTSQGGCKGIMEPEHSSYFEHREYTQYGWCWLAWSNKGVLDENGNVIGVVCVGRDITKRKEMEEELLKSRSLLEALMEYVPEGIIVCDSKDLNIHTISKFAKELFGLKEIKRRHVLRSSEDGRFTILHKDGRLADIDELPLTRAARSGEVIIGEEWAICINGDTKIHLLCDAGPIFDVDGTLRGGILVFRDMKSIQAEREALIDAYNREHRIAEILQNALMPDVLIKPSGYEIAAHYKPALKEAEVGGDFYDVFSLCDGRTVVVMGDISGKGLPAAVHTAMVKYMIRAFAHLNPDPSWVLSQLNTAMCANTPEELFVTVFYCVLDRHQHSIIYANGGHDQPLIYKKNMNEVIPLDITGPIIGVIREGKFHTRDLMLSVGDHLVLYTDGITDAGSGGECLGIDGLSDILLNLSGDNPFDVADAVLAAAIKASDNLLRDDAAVLAITAEHHSVFNPKLTLEEYQLDLFSCRKSNLNQMN